MDPLDVATRNRLRRLDRRLRVEPSPGFAGRYDIVYDDADGVRCVALPKVREFHDGVFRQLLQCMPWRFNQTFAQFIRRNVDEHNARLEERIEKDALAEAGERVWEDLEFLNRRSSKRTLLHKQMMEEKIRERERVR